MKNEQELLEVMYNHYNYQCFVCLEPANQRAHIIGNTKLNRRVYGNEIIDNPLNWLPACSLKCNAKIDVGKNELLKERICLTIESEVLTNDEKRGIIEEMVKENIQRKEAKVDNRIYNQPLKPIFNNINPH